METDFEVQGLKELYDTLQQVPVKLEKSILRGAIRAGAKLIAEEAKRLAPELKSNDPRRVVGALAKSIRIMSTNMSRGMIRGGVVAGGKASVGKGRYKIAADAFYAMWVEYGHLAMGKGAALMGGRRSKNQQRANLKAAGATFVAAQPFMRPAIDSKTAAAIDATAQYIRDRVEAGDLNR